jgi:uncharacterized protein YozE (UPF0346 family)
MPTAGATGPSWQSTHFLQTLPSLFPPLPVRAPLISPVAQSSPPALSPLPPLPPRPDNRTRYYIHGDQREDEPSLYYCARCDVFFDAQHFSEHSDINGERYLSSVGSWNRRDTSRRDTRRRPDNAINILAAAAIAEKAAYEASRAPFHRWLESQMAKQDPVGDLARDIHYDKSFPVAATTRAEVEAYMEDRHAPSLGAIAALKLGWARFTASQQRAARRLQRVNMTPVMPPAPMWTPPPAP